MRRRWAIAVAALLLVAAAAAGVAVYRLRTEQPLATLPRDPPAAVSVVEQRREVSGGRVLLHVVLHGETVGEIRFVVSLPDPAPTGAVPLVMVLGGLSGTSHSIRLITEIAGDPGPNAFIGYDWPLPPRAPGLLDIVLHLRRFRRAVVSVPGQVDAILAWASRQRWADPERVSLLGFSLGAFVVPAAQRLAEERGAPVGWTVLGYGGAPIGAVIAGHPGIRPAWLARPLGAAADLLLRPIEPSKYLPHLRGRFLLVRAAHDHLISKTAADRLAELTPEPRTILVVEGDHVGVAPRKQQLLEKVVSLSHGWLVAEGAILPAGGARQTTPARASGSAEVSLPR